MRGLVVDGGGEDRGSILEVETCICWCVLAVLHERGRKMVGRRGAGSFAHGCRGSSLTCSGATVSFDFDSAEQDPRP